MATASTAFKLIAQRLDYKHEQYAADIKRASYI
jgi:hypothetical protein